jgi:hypothetical protein
MCMQIWRPSPMTELDGLLDEIRSHLRALGDSAGGRLVTAAAPPGVPPRALPVAAPGALPTVALAVACNGGPGPFRTTGVSRPAPVWS